MTSFDIRVLRGEEAFGASADSTTVSFGATVVTASTIVRITSVTYSSCGPDTAAHRRSHD